MPECCDDRLNSPPVIVRAVEVRGAGVGPAGLELVEGDPRRHKTVFGVFPGQRFCVRVPGDRERIENPGDADVLLEAVVVGILADDTEMSDAAGGRRVRRRRVGRLCL